MMELLLRRTRFAIVVCAMASAMTLQACGSSKVVDQYALEGSVEQIYNAAMDLLVAEDYYRASQLFDEVERQHPYSIWATKAQLMSAYAHYQADNYDDAIIGLDRFIQLHPSNPDVAYAYYLKALSYYEQIVDVQRDQLATRRALDALDEVVRRFPDTDYARDARLKMDLTRDHLAGKEMSIGRFYLRRNNLLAAINRFKAVVDDYQTTSHVPEALHRLTEAYTALGLVNEARRVAAVLGHNYPGSNWYVDTYALVEGVQVAAAPDRGADSGGFFSRTMSSVGSVFQPTYSIPRLDEGLMARSRERAADEAERMAAVAARPDESEPEPDTAAEARTPPPAAEAGTPDPLAAKRAELLEELRAVREAAAAATGTEPPPRAVEARPLTPGPAPGPAPGAPRFVPRSPAGSPAAAPPAPGMPPLGAAAPGRQRLGGAAAPQPAAPTPTESTTGAGSALPTATIARRGGGEPEPARIRPSTTIPPSADRDLATRRLEESRASLATWRERESTAETAEQRERAAAQRHLAESSTSYWEAMLRALGAVGEDERAQAQRELAARAAAYRKALEEIAPDERTRASEADMRRLAEDAAMVRNDGGRSPSGSGSGSRRLPSTF